MKSWTSKIRDFQISDFYIFAHSQLIQKFEIFKHLNFRLSIFDFQMRKLGSLPGRGFASGRNKGIAKYRFSLEFGVHKCKTLIFARSLEYILP